MIQAIVFDLDGTLVQSEKLKAEAYAIAVQRLRRLPKPDQRAIEAYQSTVGASREVASQVVIDQLGLEPELRPLMAQYEASEPWQVLTQMRTTIYKDMVADPQGAPRQPVAAHHRSAAPRQRDRLPDGLGNDVVPK